MNDQRKPFSFEEWCAQPGTDVYGNAWSTWTPNPRQANQSSPARMDTQRPVKPPTAVGGHRVTAGGHHGQLELAI